MDAYLAFLLIGGCLILLVAWLPLLIDRLPLSLPIICVGFGYALFWALPDADGLQPLRHPDLVEHFTELVVIVALAGAGLRIDRPLGLRRWRSTWRLLLVGMPLSILGNTLLGAWGFGLAWPVALLVGAALAPTDPVLAADVQVGPPLTGGSGEVRFALTSEAGLNDGLSFPFVTLALLLCQEASAPQHWLQHWLALEVVWKIAAGIGVGVLVGRGLGWVTFKVPGKAQLSRTGHGFVSLGITFLAYGLCQWLDGYGFIAVFVAGLALRAAERGHEYHGNLVRFSEEIERLLTMALLVMFGGALAGGLLTPLTWTGAAAGLLCIFVVRPVAGYLCLLGMRTTARDRAAIAFFGIRGIGSIYYIAYAANHAQLAGVQATLWAAIGFVVLSSILLHGVTVTPVMQWLDKARERMTLATDEHYARDWPAAAGAPVQRQAADSTHHQHHRQ